MPFVEGDSRQAWFARFQIEATVMNKLARREITCTLGADFYISFCRLALPIPKSAKGIAWLDGLTPAVK